MQLRTAVWPVLIRACVIRRDCSGMTPIMIDPRCMWNIGSVMRLSLAMVGPLWPQVSATLTKSEGGSFACQALQRWATLAATAHCDMKYGAQAHWTHQIAFQLHSL